MKSTKSYKISVLFTAFILCVVAAFCSFNFGSVKADSKASDPGSYFAGTAELAFQNNNLVATMEEGETFSGFHELVIDDLAIEFKVAEDVEKFSIVLKTDSYYINGNPVQFGSEMRYRKEIENELTIKLTDSATECSINRGTAVSSSAIAVQDGVRNVKVEFGVDSNHLVFANVNGKKVSSNNKEFAVERVDKTTALYTVKLDKIAEDAENAQKIEVVSIDQNTNDTTGAYKQTFEVDANGKLTDKAVPRITLSDDVFIKDLDSGKFDKLVMLADVEKAYSIKVHSVLNDTTISKVSIASSDDDKWIAKETSPKKIAFGRVDKTENSSFNFEFDFDGQENFVIDTYSVKVIDENVDNKAPIYIDNTDAFNAYKAMLDEAVYQYASDNKTKVSISLGTQVNLPSMRDLVYDEYTPYADLDASVKYFTDSNQSQSDSEMSFKITAAGKYVYYVVFADNFDNSMKEESFRAVNEEDENIYIDGEYKKYIFSFDVEDNAPIKIETSSAQGVGYKGIEYQASKFIVEAEGCKTTYTLYYNPNVNAKYEDEGWIAIPAAKSVTSQDYSDEYGNTYDSVKAVGYDGELTFTPTQYGSYMIKCVATSDYTTRTDSDYSILHIDKDSSTPTFVKVPSYWLRDNIWSVVFLSVGTLCLIGIVVLLFIKPRDETESD